jgi:hypothetical protein
MIEISTTYICLSAGMQQQAESAGIGACLKKVLCVATCGFVFFALGC